MLKASILLGLFGAVFSVECPVCKEVRRMDLQSFPTTPVDSGIVKNAADNCFADSASVNDILKETCDQCYSLYFVTKGF